MYPRIYNLSKRHRTERRKALALEDSFRCAYCHAHVSTQAILSGVQNRNHCPYCLYSRHVDHARSGDRMSACKASMQPIGLTIKHSRNKYGDKASGELMLVHRCSGCGKLSINRIAADDEVDRLIEVYNKSFELEVITLQQIMSDEIHMLQRVDLEMVLCQLQGCPKV